MNILVLCHGNINRSPLAEAVLREELASTPQVHVRSAALKPGCKPHRAARKMRNAALDHGYLLDDHRAHEVTELELKWADLIVYMDDGNKRRLDALQDVYGLQRDTACLASYVGEKRIPDPNFRKGDSPEFHATVELIIRSSRALALHFKQ